MALPSLPEIPTLMPAQLSNVTVSAIEDLLREGRSPNTVASYRSALRYWAAWFGLRYGAPIALPVPSAAVLQFIVDHAQRISGARLVHELPQAIDQALVDRGFKGKPGPLSLATLKHRIYVLSRAHDQRGLQNPCQDPKVRELLAMTARAYARRGVAQKKKAALTRDPLDAMLATCDGSLRGKRDRALLLFAWASGGRRRSEVAAADMGFLKQTGPAEFVYELAYSKTNQGGHARAENFKPVVGAAARALADWLEAAGVTEGALFRRIFRGGHVGPGLSAAAVRDIVRARAVQAGLDSDFSAHSLRSGFVTEASRRRVPLAQTMAMSGHTSVQSVLGYTRVEELWTAAHLLDSPDATPAPSTARNESGDG